MIGSSRVDLVSRRGLDVFGGCTLWRDYPGRVCCLLSLSGRATRSFGHDAFYRIVSIVLGLLLLTAAALKGYELSSGTNADGGLWASRWLRIGFVEFELVFGLWLLAGLYPWHTWILAMVCFSGFASTALYMALAGEASCGCFGKVPLSPWYTLIIDLMALAMLLWVRPDARAHFKLRAIPERAASFVTVAFWTGLVGLIAMGRASDGGEPIVLNPETWGGQRMPIIDRIDVSDIIRRGNWIVVLYRHECPACRKAIPKYEQFARNLEARHSTTRIALVEVPPYAIQEQDSGVSNSNCLLGRLDDLNEWIIETPAEIAVRDGVVAEDGVLEGELIEIRRRRDYDAVGH